MTRLLTVLLFFFFLLPEPVRAQQSENCCSFPTKTRTLRELGSEYRRLRRQAGSTCCNRFNSGLMKVMSALRDSLQPGIPAKRVTKLMGRPDLRRSKRYGAIEPSAGEKVLIYHWRGSHDFLYFIVSRGRVTKSEWYNAWE
jgi:hypothetical protein